MSSNRLRGISQINEPINVGMVPDTASYAKRLSSLIVIAGALALASLGEHIQAEHIYAQYEQDLLQTIAASSYVNLLLVSLYTTYYLLVCIYRAFLQKRQSTSSFTSTKDISARIICLASDSECEKLQFKEQCRIQRVKASMQIDENAIPVEYITPAWLWYYIYAVGTGVFVLGYALHGGHELSSCVLACSLTLCSLYSCIREAVVSGDMYDILVRSGSMLILVTSVILLCVHTSDDIEMGVDPEMPRRALQSTWLGLVLPALAPLALHACRHRVSLLSPYFALFCFSLRYLALFGCILL